MRPRRRQHSEQGSATVLVLGAILACCMLCGLWVDVARAALARQRAETAADFAALAAARSIAVSADPAGGNTPCAAATTIAQRNGARLKSCLVDAGHVDVTVAVTRPTGASARARAGPVAIQ